MSEMTQRVLREIDRRSLRPRPRWQFALLQGFAWSLFVVSICVGAGALALLWRVYSYGDMPYFAYHARDFWRYASAVGALLYVLSLAVALMVLAFVRTLARYGYRIRYRVIVTIFLVASVVLAWSITAMGTVDSFERLLWRSAQQHVHDVRSALWHMPQRGLYVGVPLVGGDAVPLLVTRDGAVHRMDLRAITSRERVILQLAPRVIVFAPQRKDRALLVCAVRALVPPRHDPQLRRALHAVDETVVGGSVRTRYGETFLRTVRRNICPGGKTR